MRAIGSRGVAVVGAVVVALGLGGCGTTDGTPRGEHVVAPSSVALPYRVDVPDVADAGCPPHAFDVPAPSSVATVGTGAGASEATVPLGDGAHLLAVCLGRVADVGTVDEIAAAPASEGTTLVGTLDVTSPHGDGVRRTTRIGDQLLSDHLVERDGWVHVVGYLRRADQGDRHQGVVDAVLSSWSWTGR
ncbi:hypothetical protein [Cellulomonas carbonis]|uniref:hypothetical protein n=1 Tax=Cellulomonas carbonis TaxID=1386092 RepID=UPI00126A481D|nr:hypothetical protein [Cellulomonas carbonis]GGB96029.1 hypothetical protein GCM10010972_05960 [Cellulomonas carbonis]